MTDKLDVISWDSYPRFHNDYESLTDTFARSAFDHAVMRSMKKDRPFMLMESVPGLVNWHDYNTLCYLSGFPGSGLNELFGVTIEELDTYYPNDKNYVTFSNKKQGTVKDYAERIQMGILYGLQTGSGINDRTDQRVNYKCRNPDKGTA